ncbi:UPF0014 membrane protein [Galdieria sulphuraria]|nr:UPF0014 membrane protein [Galdieria sulphuraria]
MSCPDTGAIPLDPEQLIFAGGFLIANIVAIHLLELGLERDITLGGFRATVQLLMLLLCWPLVLCCQ